MAEGSSRPLRCAVYTRKSSDEGLGQEFNSLHAQREACEAYILSQKHEGWRLVTKAYDDGGFSGGNMDRPALKSLLADIAAGSVDIVVVYKIDRLTRSLHDFSRIVEVLDKSKGSFVSVTQAFNTTTSMGRLTLNVLLSFAQFEREVTGERIRDKIAASKAKGMWMGGYRPLGYRIEGRELKPHPVEAPVIAELFSAFLEFGSVDAFIAAADRRALFDKLERRSDGPMSRGAVYYLLRNPLYVGEIRHKDLRYPGRHEAIVSREVFDAVQSAIAQRRRVRTQGLRSRAPALLTGLLFDAEGRGFTPSTTLRRGRIYGYYSLIGRAPPGAISRLPAGPFESHVKSELLKAFTSVETILQRLFEEGVPAPEPAMQKIAAWAQTTKVASTSEQRLAFREVIHKLVVTSHGLAAEVRFGSILETSSAATFKLELPLFLTRRGSELRIMVSSESGSRRTPDAKLVALVAKGMLWFDQLKAGLASSREEIAEREGVTAAYVGHLLEFAFLAPDLKRDILIGAQPPQLTTTLLKSLCPLPLDWEQQRRIIRSSCVSQAS